MPVDVKTYRRERVQADVGLEQVLLDMGVRPAHVQIALKRAEDTGEALTTIMRDYGFLTHEQVAEAISKSTGLEYFAPENIDLLDSESFEGLALPIFKGYIPIGTDSAGEFCILVSDSVRANDAGNEYFDKPNKKIMVASESTLQTLYRTYFAHTEEEFDKAVGEFVALIESKSREEDPSLIRDIFCTLIRHACYSGASDLYIYQSELVGVIKLKINGVGAIFRSVPIVVYDRIMNKLVSENTKAEDLAREPREAIVNFDNEEDRARMEDILSRYGFRLELAQSRGQKSAVIRLLDKQAAATELGKLGFDAESMAAIKQASGTSTGLVIVTGPTGSGKTTSLYAMLKSLDPVEKSIQSIENPIEYRHGLWIQYEMRKDTEDEGVEANVWLKALLRNAPDVILMGEVRDAKVAGILLDAANTGHLVFTTLHTNSAALALARLKQLRVNMDSLASVLLCVLAQRLVRVLCPKCKQKDARPETLEFLDVDYIDREGEVYQQGEGCPHCAYTGYRGRRMIYELLEVTQDVRHLIESDATPSTIAGEGIKHGRSMWANGIKLLSQGVTSIEEVLRVSVRD